MKTFEEFCQERIGNEFNPWGALEGDMVPDVIARVMNQLSPYVDHVLNEKDLK